MTRSPTENNISLAFQNLSIKKRKSTDVSAFHELIMKMDDKITDSDVIVGNIIESVLKELLEQNVISNHKTSHGFDSFFQNPEISHRTIQLPKKNH